LPPVNGISWAAAGAFLLATSVVAHWLLGLLELIAVCAIVIAIAVRRPWPHIGIVSIEVPPRDSTPGKTWTYPVKVYCTIRNDSPMCSDVWTFDYRPGAVTLKKFVTSDLQLELAKKFWPIPDGVDHIAVVPNQQFKAWVGVDDNKSIQIARFVGAWQEWTGNAWMDRSLLGTGLGMHRESEVMSSSGCVEACEVGGR
jgi:hypothetical protein